MKRRELLAGFASAAAFAVTARSQPVGSPVVGFLNQESAEILAQPLPGFQKGLRETGFIADQNVSIEYRWAEAQYERLDRLAIELVGRGVAVLVAAYFPAAVAAKKATSTIPIVFISGADPVAAGLVSSLNRPGGNLTGMTNFNTRLTAKRLELLQQISPRAAMIAVLVNSKTPVTPMIESELRVAAQTLGVRAEVLGAASEDEIDRAFATAVARGAGAMLVSGDAYFNSRRSQITTLAGRHKLPAIYDRRDIAAAGGLLSYGMNYFDFYRQAGIYTGQILKGAKPADLPVQQPSKVVLVVNLKTAKSLGLELPTSVLLSADEVID
jgi:putative ABC transport system substrate-binding protein